MEELVAQMAKGDELSRHQKEGLATLIRELEDRFSSKPGRTEVLKYDIELTSETPVRLRPYCVSRRQQEILRVEINKMLDLAVIERGESDFSSPVILVEVPGRNAAP